MASRYWTFIANLIAGQTARAEQVNEKYSEIDTALGLVGDEMNRTVRLMDGTPGQSDYQLQHNPAQRANKGIGFDAGGNLGLFNLSFAWRGNWAAGVQYNLNDVVKAPVEYSYSLYIVRTAHVSIDFADDLLASRLEVIVDLTEARRSLILHQLIIGPDTVDLEVGQDVMVDVSGGPVNLVLPAVVSISDQPINIMHVGGSVGANAITVEGNGNTIMGLPEDMVVDTENASFGLAFGGPVYGWRIRGV